MPSIYDAAIKATTSPAEKALWAQYFGLVDRLYARHIWRYDYGSEGLSYLRDDKTRRPPRFVAVIESDEQWQAIQNEVEELEGLKTKWPVQLIDQRWGWGRVTINQAQHSQRLESKEMITILPPVNRARGGEDNAKRVIEILKNNGHGGQIIDGYLNIIAGKNGLTLRQGSGRAFILRGWSENGDLLGRYSVGVVILRGVALDIQLDEPRNKKQRKDTKKLIASWESYQFYE